MRPEHEKTLCEALARQGEEVAGPLSPSPGVTPGQVRECKQFMRFIRDHKPKAARRPRKNCRANHREEN